MKLAQEMRPKGVLVVHADGAAAWTTELVPAVASVLVPVGRGVVFEVDAADPSTVLRWAMQADGEAEKLGAAFDDPEFVARLQLLRETGAEVFQKSAPTLTKVWVRRATVAAVAQCTVRPVSEEALLLDLAAADYGTERLDLAVSLFRTAAPALIGYGRECLRGGITGGAASEIAELASTASAALAGSGWAPDLAALTERLSDATELSDQGLASLLDEWAPEKVLLATRMDPVHEAIDGGFIDPLAVPPRLFRWLGADTQDINVSYDGGEELVVSAQLSAALDVGSPDAEELVAYAAKDGGLVAVAPMRIDGDSVTAVLTSSEDPEELSYGIYHADTDPADLRLDDIGLVMVRVDRSMLDAYSHQRLALSAAYEKDATEDTDAMIALAASELARAKAAVNTALARLKRVARSAQERAGADVITARLAAIDAYRATLNAGTSAPLGTTPLLSELLPVPPDEAVA